MKLRWWLKWILKSNFLTRTKQERKIRNIRRCCRFCFALAVQGWRNGVASSNEWTSPRRWNQWMNETKVREKGNSRDTSGVSHPRSRRFSFYRVVVVFCYRVSSEAGAVFRQLLLLFYLGSTRKLKSSGSRTSRYRVLPSFDCFSMRTWVVALIVALGKVLVWPILVFFLRWVRFFILTKKKRHLIGGNAPASVQFPQHWHCWVMEEKKILIQHFFMKPLFLSPFPRDCPARLVENYKKKSFEPINKMLIGSITGSDGDAVRLWLERERCRFLFTFIDSSILQSLCERWLCRVLLDFTES